METCPNVFQLEPPRNRRTNWEITTRIAAGITAANALDMFSKLLVRIDSHASALTEETTIPIAGDYTTYARGVDSTPSIVAQTHL